ncbi:MAG: hypothetical protein NTY64_01140, partial [Deltaproteobacteria bacterium]|nr:hypothetical protein [Deltaproteobacteria bacterium]
SEEEIHAYHLRTEMMAHTTAVRNWAYFHQMNRIVFDLAALIGPDFQAEYKIHPLTILKLLLKLTEERNGLLNDHLDKMRACIRKSNYKEMMNEYNRMFPDIKAIEGENIELMWEQAGRNKDTLTAMLVCHSDLRLENIYSFSIDHAESILEEKVDRGILQRILSRLSFKFGDLKDLNKEYIILTDL